MMTQQPLSFACAIVSVFNLDVLPLALFFFFCMLRALWLLVQPF